MSERPAAETESPIVSDVSEADQKLAAIEGLALAIVRAIDDLTIQEKFLAGVEARYRAANRDGRTTEAAELLRVIDEWPL